MKFLFVFGNTPDLSLEELKNVLLRHKIEFTVTDSNRPLVTIETSSEIPQNIFSVLGGTYKVARVFSEDQLSLDNLGQNIADFISINASTRITFGLSVFADKFIPALRLSQEVKDILEEKGIKSRFVLAKSGEKQLSSVVVLKQMVAEIIICQKNAGFFLAKTIWTQDFEDWGVRDFGRPAVDPHIGMLPPKVARMMVNIASAKLQNDPSNFTILDPFCGVGTILIEALTINVSVIGSDINPAQINKTKKNLQWLGKNCPLQVADARKISIPPVDAIVTEPFLGPGNLQVLEELYIACFSHWKTILKPGGRVVIALPSFNLPAESLLQNVLDKVKIMGYSLHASPFSYFRPQAKVRRNICILNYGTY